MSKPILSRRILLRRGLELPLGLLLANAGAGRLMAADSHKVCADPNAMDSGQRGFRDSLHYSGGCARPGEELHGQRFLTCDERSLLQLCNLQRPCEWQRSLRLLESEKLIEWKGGSGHRALGGSRGY